MTSSVEIPLSRTTSRIFGKTSTSRIVVLDYLKGFAACWFTLGHMMMYYQDDSWETIMSITILLLDWLTICLFVSCTIIGTMISIRQKEATGNSRGMFINAVKKSIYFFIVGEIFNIVIDNMNTYHAGIWHVFGANMITVVALAQLFTYGLVKLSKRFRFFMAIALIVTYPLLLNWCLTGITLTPERGIIVSSSTLTTAPYIVYYLLFDMDAMMPTLSWLITATLTSIVFEDFVMAHVKYSSKIIATNSRINSGRESLKNALENLAIFGFITIACGIMLGGFILTPGLSSSATEYSWITNNDAFRFYYLGGLPLFLARHTPLYLVYNLGVFTVIFSILHYHESFSKRKLFLQDSMARFGKYSFSVFVYGEAWYLLPLKLNLFEYLVICIPLVVALYIGVNIWAIKGKGIGSLEWGLMLYTRLIDKYSGDREKRD